MDYLSRCYTARVRPYRDSDDEVTLTWYFCAPGAKVFPGTHRFGSQVWREIADDPPDGPGEIFGKKPFSPGYNPGYLGLCHVGPDDWYALGVPRDAITGPPAPFPACCYQQPQSGLGSRTGLQGFGIHRQGPRWGTRGGWGGLDGPAGTGFWGTRGGFTATTGRGYAGSWGGLSGWRGGAGPYIVGRWGGLSGWQGLQTNYQTGDWGGLSGWRGGAGPYIVGRWGDRSGLAGHSGPYIVGRWGDRSGWIGHPGRGVRGDLGLAPGPEAYTGIITAFVYATNTQSIPNATRTAMNFDSVAYDPHGMWSAGHPSRLTVPIAGTYLFSAMPFWAAAGGAPVWQALPGKNGVGQYYLNQLPLHNSLVTGATFPFVMPLAAGDYVELLLWQNSGAALLTSVSPGLGGYMQLTWLGPTG